MFHRPKCKVKRYTTSRIKYENKLCNLELGIIFLNSYAKAYSQKYKNR